MLIYKSTYQKKNSIYQPDLSGIFEQYSIISIICIAWDVGNGLMANSFGKYYKYIDIMNKKRY
jgi:hypothetical protein